MGRKRRRAEVAVARAENSFLRRSPNAAVYMRFGAVVAEQDTHQELAQFKLTAKGAVKTLSTLLNE